MDYIMDCTREKIYLAALLHDIGKFYQRADTGSIASSKFLKEYCKDETSFCPNHNGNYTHKHVLWTAQFIDDYSPIFKRLADADIDDMSNKNNLINLASGHHLHKDQLTDLGNIIKEADCLSSGMDRDNAFQDAQDESNWDSFKKTRMTSILQTINRGNDMVQQWQHLPVEAMSLDRSIFPKGNFETSPDYSSLWDKFNEEFKYIQADTYHAFSETLLNLLLKYTSCIPASTIDFPDVSLYDHLKTTAALAVCLYDWSKEENRPNNPFLLIGADFSGIQPYIYQIVSKHAGKNLKGRSFYLKLLSDTIVRYLLKELGIYQANIVYNSGGGFYLLAPNTTHTKNKLKCAIETIEKKLMATHGTALFVAIDSIELSKDALLHKNGESLGVTWGNLFSKRDKKKEAKFSNILLNNYSSFFEPFMQGGNAARDSVTGEEFLPNEKINKSGDLLLKESTFDQIKIGTKLRETNLIVVCEGDTLPYWNDKTHLSPLGLGFTYYFLNSTNDLASMKEQLRASADKVTVITMNGQKGDCDFIHTIDGINNIYSLDFYGGNEIDGKNVPTFEQMCENENFSRMGVLRMDVDNLGKIFQKGISPDRATLSRFAALSRSFDMFFSGYLNTIWRDVCPEKSFIIYSGGDDVFIVGIWDITLELAKRIRKKFGDFTCNNPAFSLSGGIAIIPPKYPIMKGAEESDKEEKRAKRHTSGDEEKNSISFMNTPLNWNNEFPPVELLKTKILEGLNTDKIPKSFVSKLMLHYSTAKIKNNSITNAKTFWMLTYDLSRMKGRNNNSSTNAMIDNCIIEVCDKKKGTLNGEKIKSNYHPLQLWAFAARWAELEYRTQK